MTGLARTLIVHLLTTYLYFRVLDWSQAYLLFLVDCRSNLWVNITRLLQLHANFQVSVSPILNMQGLEKVASSFLQGEYTWFLLWECCPVWGRSATGGNFSLQKERKMKKKKKGCKNNARSFEAFAGYLLMKRQLNQYGQISPNFYLKSRIMQYRKGVPAVWFRNVQT